MTSPRISIVLPTYNGSDFLSQALDSILNQTYADFELIIVDDASTDETPRIIADYAKRDKRIRVIRNPENQHIAASLNIGFKTAKGQYLTWTSDDNLYRPTALAVMVDYLDNHPETGLVYTDWTRYNVIDRAEQTMHLDMAPADILNGCIVGPCFMYRKDIAQTVGPYDSTYPLVQDYDYWLRFYLKTSFASIPQDLYIYRLHPKCLTERKRQQLWRETDLILQKYIPLYVERFPELYEQFGSRCRQIAYLRHPSTTALSDIQQDIGRRATYRFLKKAYRVRANPLLLKHMAGLGMKYRVKAWLLYLKGK